MRSDVMTGEDAAEWFFDVGVANQSNEPTGPGQGKMD